MKKPLMILLASMSYYSIAVDTSQYEVDSRSNNTIDIETLGQFAIDGLVRSEDKTYSILIAKLADGNLLTCIKYTSGPNKDKVICKIIDHSQSGITKTKTVSSQYYYDLEEKLKKQYGALSSKL
jgi:hypothetical protein